jgi:hypothetical protein
MNRVNSNFLKTLLFSFKITINFFHLIIKKKITKNYEIIYRKISSFYYSDLYYSRRITKDQQKKLAIKNQ